MTAEPTCVAFIPARAGSRRIPNKNVRLLAGHPLVAYSIAAAVESGVFDAVVVSTDSDVIARVALDHGAEVPFLRPASLADDDSPDILWVRHAIRALTALGRRWDCFSILRPTSPFRRAATIQRAWRAFVADGRADSLRAVQPCREHPGKMWTVDGDRIRPLLENPAPTEVPWHSMPYQALPAVLVQNASLEIARTEILERLGTIAGSEVLPFLTEGLEGFDINVADDWILAEHHAQTNPDSLPVIRSR